MSRLEMENLHHHRTLILLTHRHLDHAGAVGQLIDKNFAQTVGYFVSNDLKNDKGNGDPFAEKLYDQRFPRLPEPRVLHDREVLNFGNVTIEIIHTPGHTPDHCCLLVKIEEINQNFLILGDVIGGISDSIGSDPELQIRSVHAILEIIKKNKVDFVLEGHGSVTVPVLKVENFIRQVRGFGEQKKPGFSGLEDLRSRKLIS